MKCKRYFLLKKLGKSGNAVKTFKHAPSLSDERYCCCSSVFSYVLFQMRSTVAVILCARTFCFRCKLLLLLFCVLANAISDAKYCCCYSVCSYILFQMQSTVAVILCARTFCFRCKVLLQLFCVLVHSLSDASYCCCYSVFLHILFQMQSTVAVILCARTFSFRHKMLLLLFSVFGAALFLLLQHYRAKMRPVVEKAEKIPGPKALPLFGNALEFGTSTKGNKAMFTIIGPKYRSLLLETVESCLLNS